MDRSDRGFSWVVRLLRLIERERFVTTSTSPENDILVQLSLDPQQVVRYGKYLFSGVWEQQPCELIYAL